MFLPIIRKLKRLNLGGNLLTSVPQRALSIFDSLKKLELQENKIKTIKEGDFEGEHIFEKIIVATKSNLLNYFRLEKS